MHVMVTCPDCYGSGAIPSYIPNSMIRIDVDKLPYYKCKTCDGVGQVIVDMPEITNGHSQHITG